MDTQQLLIDKSIIDLPSNLLNNHFIGNLYRLSSINYIIYIDSNSSSSLGNVLLDRHFKSSDDLDTSSSKTFLTVSFENNQFLVFNNTKRTHQSDSFEGLVDNLILPVRVHSLNRKTKETSIEIELNLDGTGNSSIDTGIPFFDHMIDQIAKHSRIDLILRCKGDLHVDEHHTIEDVALALGEAILGALKDKKGIERYAFVMPMDESSCEMSIDLSGRPFLVYDADFKREYVGDFPTDMTKHFFYSLAMTLKATLHIKVSGENDHHKIESMFKAFALILRNAVKRDEKALSIIPSSKGVL